MSDPSIRRSDLTVDTIRIPRHRHVDLNTRDFVFHSTVAMSNPPDVPSQQDPDLTFASRNPTKVVHPSRVRPRVKLSDAQKVSAASKREINKENASALKVEIDAFFDHRDTEISRLAKKFNKSEVKIKQLLSNETNYQKTRAPTLRNALVHAKGIEMNEG
jgi:hypothetical protein